MAKMKACFPYYGGKHYMLKDIMPLQLYLNGYCEPFAGSLKVFFARHKVPVEIINDKDDRIVNFYEVVQNPESSEELQILINSTLHSESQHKRAKEWLKNGKEPVKRAWALWCVITQCISNKIGEGWAIPCKKDGKQKTQVFSNKPNVKKYCKRIENLSIFCRDAIDVIQKVDTEDMYFYIDPPYPGADQGHYKGYKMDDFMQLLKLLQSIKGKFLLSSGDYKVLDMIASEMGWNQKKIKQKSTAGPNSNKERLEVLTWNYTIQKNLFSA